MATYLELSSIKSDAGFNDLQQKIRVACVKKASDLIELPTPTTAQVQWAVECLDNPSAKSNQIENYVLAANSEATISQILGATDTLIQTNVDAAVDKITSV